VDPKSWLGWLTPADEWTCGPHHDFFTFLLAAHLPGLHRPTRWGYLVHSYYDASARHPVRNGVCYAVIAEVIAWRGGGMAGLTACGASGRNRARGETLWSCWTGAELEQRTGALAHDCAGQRIRSNGGLGGGRWVPERLSASRWPAP